MNWSDFQGGLMPFVFILLAGAAPTYFWRAMGVGLGARLDQQAPALVFVRSMAVGLVAAVVGKLVFYPTGVLAGSPLFIRLAAAAAGFAAFLLFGKRVWTGVLAAEAVLVIGLLLF